jgi:hypothetical protein
MFKVVFAWRFIIKKNSNSFQNTILNQTNKITGLHTADKVYYSVY